VQEVWEMIRRRREPCRHSTQFLPCVSVSHRRQHVSASPDPPRLP